MEFNLPSKIVIAAGTYDGVLAGWELDDKTKKMKLTFATTVHAGSIRSLSLAASPNGDDAPGSLLSSGYDETLRTHDWHKRLTSSGEIRTPSDFGTPVCSAFAPPTSQSTHCILGFSNGKIAIYKKRDWSIQHVLAGHDGGVASLAVHPSGKLALSGGVSDGKLKLWDLTKGRLAYVNKTTPASSTPSGRTRYDPILSIIWSNDGHFYALAYGSHVTVREVASGKDLLDVDLPSRVNQVTLMKGEKGLFVAAACNDGSLPVLAVQDSNEESRRAIMAIEPIDSVVAGEERFKCISCVYGYYVVTANSAGVVSLMNLEGAVNMIMENESDDSDEEASSPSENDDKDSDDKSETADSDNLELAVDIIDTAQLGTGARITCLAAWCSEKLQANGVSTDDDYSANEESSTPGKERNVVADENGPKRKRPDTNNNKVTMDSVTLQKARDLVNDAKNLKKRKDRKKRKQTQAQ